jgi:transposase
MDKHIEKEVARKAKAMTRQEVFFRAYAGVITWQQAAYILRMSPRNMRRLKAGYQKWGISVFVDGRGGKKRRRRISVEKVEELCRLKRDRYPDFSIKHFHEMITEKHGIAVSYSWTRHVLQAAGLVEKAPARGKYRRQRERRPMRGMMLHIDGSRHEWLAGQPMWDLIIVLDDADGKLLYARFVEEEGTLSTLEALGSVLKSHGRFCELYHDCGSHFGKTSKAEEGPDEVQDGQVSRVLKALGIRQIFARSPQARGRCERAYGTIQGRLPQELRVEGVRTYEQANAYLERRFIKDFNRKFTVPPAQPESAFTPLAGIDLKLLLSAQHERVVRNDNTVQFQKTILQLPSTRDRAHFVRCPVLVHEFPRGTLGVSYQGKQIAEYSTDGELIRTERPKSQRKKRKAA